MKIPDDAEKVIKKLENSGYEAYVVGGCVRDYLMGKKPFDYDVMTNARPDEIKKIFEDFKVILTGEKHGTVTVVSEGENIEVTTYRIDGEYKNSRSPEEVFFAEKAENDLSRRDFTMNAICYRNGFTDPFGGMKDIENKIIRTVGESDRRFGEDALRIMRALRFSATLGFEIEEETKKSIHRQRMLLKNISPERIWSEFKKLLMGEYCENVLMEFHDVISVFAPCMEKCVGFDQKNRYHVYDVYTHMVKSVVFAPCDLRVRLCMLFHDVGKPDTFTFDETGGHFKGHALKSRELAKEVFDNLRIDNDTKNVVLDLIEHHGREIVCEKKYVKRFLSKFSEEFFDLLVDVMRADTLAHSSEAMKNLDEIDRLVKFKNEISEDEDCLSLKNLKINGNDIIDCGISEGKRIGEILKELLEKVVDGELKNVREELFSAVEKMAESGKK